MAGSCDRDNELSTSLKSEEVIDHISDCQALKNYPIPYRKFDFKFLNFHTSLSVWPAADLSDAPDIGGLNSAPGSDSQHAINYSTLASAAAAAGAVAPGVGVGVGVDPSISSTETLLRNIQGLLKVAADNARQQERQINYEKSEYPHKS